MEKLVSDAEGLLSGNGCKPRLAPPQALIQRCKNRGVRGRGSGAGMVVALSIGTSGDREAGGG